MFFDSEKIAERKIKDAIEEGAFDSLPGKGQPLDLDDDPITPPHLRMANRILRNAGVRPEWIELDGEIRSMQEECARERQRIEREYRSRLARRTSDSRVFAEWYIRARSSYHRSLRRVNHELLKLNLIAPIVVNLPIPYQIAEEMARFDALCPLPEGLVLHLDPESDESAGKLRDSAKALYAAGLVRSRIS